MSNLRRAFSVVELREFDDGKREFEGIATTIGTDRYGDVVESMGAQFQLPIPLLWQHDAHQPVGHVTSATPTKKNIKVKGKIESLAEAGCLKDRLDEAWQSLKLGLVRHLSIGFNPIKYEQLEDSTKWGLHFLEWEWLELSLVTIPANAEASITNIKRFDEELRLAASGKQGRSFSGVPLVKLEKPKGGMLDATGLRKKGAVKLV